MDSCGKEKRRQTKGRKYVDVRVANEFKNVDCFIDYGNNVNVCLVNN